MQFSQFAETLIRPVYYAQPLEAGIEASIGIALLLASAIIAWRGNRAHPHERDWTNRRLQITGLFGIVTILLAFLRYEGIPYASMQAVLGIIALWALFSFAQLVLYRQLVLKPARVQWNERKKRDQYLPKPKARTAR